MAGNAWFPITFARAHCSNVSQCAQEKSLKTQPNQEGRDYGGRPHSKYETDRL